MPRPPAPPWCTLCAGLALSACVDSTGGQRVRFMVQAENDALIAGQAVDFVDEPSGWAVHLDAATLHLGPLYLWSDQPQLDVNGVGYVNPAGRHPRRPGPAWADLLVPSAHAAEADQLRAGNLRGELTTQVQIDLLGDLRVQLGEGTALAGPARSAELWLEPAPGAPTLTLRGEASQGDQRVPFGIELTYDDDWVDVAGGVSPTVLRRLRGLLVDADLQQGGLLTVSVDHRRFFAGADWATLLPSGPPEAADTGDTVEDLAPRQLSREDDVGDVISRRVRQVGSSGPWSLSWTAP